MAQHIDSHAERRTTGAKRGKPPVKRIPPLSQLRVKSALEDAVLEERVPTVSELLDECKAIIGITLIGLRGAEDAYKASNAISNLVRAIATVATADRVEEISDEVLSSMSAEELKIYTSKMLDKLN